MNADEVVRLRHLHEDYIRYECAIHGGTGTAITNCYSYQDGHDEFAEWIIDGFLSLLDATESLQAQLSASQRREKAAVEDFTSAAHNGNILCEFCGADCIDAGNDTGGDTCQCGCFEWRGPQEAERGATE